MNRLELQELLQKYLDENINNKEFLALREQINKSSDDDLQEIIKEHWELLQESYPLSANEKEKLYPRITSGRLLPWKVRLQRHWMQIAASFLILLVAGWALSLYRENKVIQQLATQNVVIASGESPSTVVLPDGTSVKLNSNSSLSYAADFGMERREVSLSGEGYFEVERDETRQFIVKTDYMDIKVLGTTFNVHAYEDQDFLEMALIEGSVQVNTIRPPYHNLIVKPQETVVYNKLNDELALKAASGAETVWLDTELVFRHDTLQYVFDCLERKYQVTFHVADRRLLDDVYTGVFDEKEITDVLDILKAHYHFAYTVEGRDIRIENTPEL